MPPNENETLPNLQIAAYAIDRTFEALVCLMRGGVQGKSQMQGGAPAADDEELNAQPGAPGQKAAKTGGKGTVGAGSGGAAKGTGGAAGDPATGKRY